MTRTVRVLAARLLAVAILVSASLGSVTLSAAAPTQEDVRRAKDRLDALNRDLSLLVERYNQARIRLNDVQVRLTEVRLEAERAQTEAERAIGSLNRSAALAFTGFGSQFSVLLDATSFGDFSDRLEFIGSMAQADADLATQAELARQEARWTADELAAAVEQRRDVLGELAAQKEQIDARVDQARALYAELDRRYHEALAAARAAAQAEAQQQSDRKSVV